MKTWKIQKFFGDVVYDLRSRGLLPVAIALLAGMIAVPLFLATSGSDPAPPSAPAQQTAAELAPENQTAVLAYDPGLRDYKKRLGELQSKDPFVQQFGGADVAATALSQSGLETSDTSDSSGSSGGSTGGSTEITGGGNTDGGKKKNKKKKKTTTKYFWYETDVLVGEPGAEVQVNDVDAFTFLPTQTTPVLVFLGASSDGQRGVFMVARDAVMGDGGGLCFPAPESCQLLTLAEGESRSMVYGIDGKTYTVKVTDISKVISSKPPS